MFSWHDLLDQYKKDHGGDTKVLMTEAYTTMEKMIDFYGNTQGRRGAHVPFNFIMINDINANSTTQDNKDAIDAWINNMPKETDYVPNWVVGNHDNHRVVNRFGLNRGDAINIMVQTLPGIAITYYGEEIVMTSPFISWEDTRDPQACNQDPNTFDKVTRDPARTPFQWDGTKNAGFSTANKTWIPVDSDYKTINVRKERLQADSHLNVFKRLTSMRKTRAVLQDGTFEIIADRNLLVYKREIPGSQLFVVLNFGNEDQGINVSEYFGTIKKLITASVVSSNSNIRQGFVDKLLRFDVI